MPPQFDTPPGSPETPRALRPWVRRVLDGILRAVLVVVGVVAAFLLAMQSPAIGTRTVLFVLGRIELPRRGTITVREVRGNWLQNLEFDGFRFARGDTLLVSIDTLRVFHDPRALFTGQIDIARLDLRGVTVTGDIVDTTGRTPGEVQLSLGDLLHGRFYEGQPIRLRTVTLERGRFVAGVDDSLPQVDDIALTLSDGRIGDGRMAFGLDRLEARHGAATLTAAGAVSDGRAELRRFSWQSPTTKLSGNGAIATGPALGAGIERMEWTADAAPMVLRDLRLFIPTLDLNGDVTAHIALTGAHIDSLDGTVTASTDSTRLGAQAVGATLLAATFTRGRADVTLQTVHEQASVEVTGWVRPLDTRPAYELTAIADRLPRRVAGMPGWTDFARRADFATTMHVRGEGFAPARLDFDAYLHGAAGAVDAVGTIDTHENVHWDLKSFTFADLDVARLAGQSGPSALSGTATARGQGGDFTADVTLKDSHYGDWQLAAAAARLKLDPNGRYRLTDGRFRHLALEDSDLNGRFRAEGRGSDARAWLELEPSLVRGQQVDKGQAMVVLTRGNLAFEGAAESPSGSLRFAGTARPFETTPSYDIREARFDNVDAAPWTGGSMPRTNLTGTLSFMGRGAEITAGRVHLERSRIGTVSLDGVDGVFDFTAGRARADLEVRTRGGTATLTAEGDTAAWNATGTVPFGTLAHLTGGPDTLTSEGTLRLTAEGNGVSPATARATGRAVAKGRIGNARVDSLEARVALAAGIATLDTLFLHSNVADAHGDGQLALFDTTVVVDSAAGVHVAFEVKDLEPLEPIVGIDSLGASHALLDARLYGPARHLVFDVSGAIHSLAVDGNRLVGGDLVAHGTLDRTYRLDQAQATAQLRALQAGAVRLQTAQVVARWAEGAPAFELTATLDARHRVALAGTATFDSVMTHVMLTKADIEADSASWALVRPARFAYGAQRLVIDNLEARGSALGLVRAHGTVDRRGTQSLDVEARALGLDLFAAWIGRPNVGGEIDGTLALRGPATAPEAKGSIDVIMNAQDQPAGAITTQIKWNGRRLEIDGAFAPPTGSSLTFTGYLPLALTLALPVPGDTIVAVRAAEGEVDLHIRGDRMDLAAFGPFLDPRQVGPPTGVLDVDLHLTGHSEALAGKGRLVLEKGMAELLALGVLFDDANLTAELEDDRVFVREARVHSEKGTLSGDGVLTIKGLTRIEPDLKVHAENFEAMNTKDMHVVATGDVTVTGTLGSPIVRGKASVENSEFELTEAMMEAANRVPEVRLTPADIRMMEETFGPVTAKASDPVILLYEASDLDLDVTIERNTWIRQRRAPRLALELAGNVRVRKLPHAEAELYGRIEPVPGHGYVEQFARRFDFSGGEILLNGPTNRHTVDIQTTYKSASAGDGDGSDVVVRMDVTGRVDDLKLTMSSEPAMSPTEIISFIATGRTRSDISSGTSTTASTLAAQTALAQVTGRFEDLAQESIGLDVVQIRQDAVQGATLVAGRYVSSRLYVGFRQPVQYQENDNTSTSTNYRTQVEIEYEAYQWLLLNLQGESSELNSFIRARRAY